MQIKRLALWAVGIVFCVTFAVGVALSTTEDDELSVAEEAEVDALVLPLPKLWTGDFAGMQKRHMVRVLVPYSKSFYSVDRGQQAGISYDLSVALAAWLNKNHADPKAAVRWQVMLIPVARDELISQLLKGQGDIAAGGLVITDKRAAQVAFTAPFTVSVGELWISAPGTEPVTEVTQLAGRQVMVRRSSSYFEHLTELNKTFQAQGLKPIDIQLVDENLETEDLLEMVNVGVIPATVADHYIAEAWAGLYPDMQINEAVKVHEGSAFAWAIRPDNPQLKKQLDKFVEAHKVGTLFGNSLRKDYLEQTSIVDPTSARELAKFKSLVEIFKKHAQTYDFDYLMLMAQGYQESRLDQQARSPNGAVGVMQILPSTAADPQVGIKNVAKSADNNVEAGAKYLRLLEQKYLDEPGISPTNKVLMAFAAYNAGPTNLRKFRRLAEKSGLDRDVWFGNVEHGAARIVGRETVDYVGNIYKYYVAYKLAQQRQLLQDATTNP
ncbi:MAG: lytic transglycosylase F [Pseudomonadaceae bacterium]|nr:lytic transglycosylase F [Pseudomonadaceae bacterium]HCP54066.1 lytic transglycosylase F [Pseudomonas sp.]